MTTTRRMFALPVRCKASLSPLSIHSRQQVRWRYAGHAHWEERPEPLRHKARKTTKTWERQLRHQQKQEKAKVRQAIVTQPPAPVVAPTVQETSPTEGYFIRRTPTRNLPIYQLLKRGGNLKQTRVRKIEGEGAQLVKQLEEHLHPKPEWIRVNPINRHVEMKGFYKMQIEEWLLSKGF